MRVINFSTRLLPKGDQARKWREVTGQAGISLLDDVDCANFVAADLGTVRISTLSLGRHVLDTREQPRDPTAPRQIKFIFQDEGACTIRQDGDVLALGAGDWCMLDKDKPFQVMSDGYCRQTTLTLRNEVGELSQPCRGSSRKAQSPLDGVGRILHDSLRSSIAEIGSLSNPSLLGIDHVLADLAKLTLWEGVRAQRGSASADTMQHRIARYIEDNLDDPDLSIDSIAAGLRCSKRYVHKAFLGAGTTASKLIWSRRVERCYMDLTDPSRADRTITDIAYRWGFNDSHHFSRLFRQRYGMTPRAFRGAAAEGL